MDGWMVGRCIRTDEYVPATPLHRPIVIREKEEEGGRRLSKDTDEGSESIELIIERILIPKVNNILTQEYQSLPRPTILSRRLRILMYITANLWPCLHNRQG